MITIVVGTNRKNSKSSQIAQYYQLLLQQINVDSQILDLGDLPKDFIFSALYENSGKNEEFNRLKEKMELSQKFVFIVPEYNGSFPGVLKAFIDGLSFPGSLIHKKAALVGISDGPQGGALAISHLVDIFHYLGLNVLAQRVRISFMKKNFIDGKIQDAFVEKLITEQAQLIANF